MPQIRRMTLFASLCLAVAAMPARAQHYFEAAAGWDFMSKSGDGGVNESHSYPALRASVGEALAPHVRLRFDADAMLVDFHQLIAAPCPQFGCPNQPFNRSTRGVYGVTANSLVDLESSGMLYVLGGVGLYDAYTSAQTIQGAVSAGLGLVLTNGPGPRVVLEATGHYFGSNGAAPSWIIPVTLGLRF
jgi:hypothetical protein